ncbi:two-component sensor histidine kinase [Grimontia hollisae]|uniref:histidine kinase n=1 Tax=Grimontia hollisae CIP 101886 TaxID=675812 RepID=D0I8U5_GRIHO|nr:ATP-binding protein [Grimontia hollisae]AMG28929.1 two-component sensor histidine kinase [Grimontia hollisae]EEY71860.1 probable two-component sensor histidine kinase protein [Grimontia hollisae CIP 101886]MDF2184731.1 ATP-binding protein [Grimontia hollisae]STO77245.1 Signal-transduction histidine kinase senX3 [Grimontia hollisae]STQ75806.1 Signal-transduction histidine kinase senX3 [Grimontia hollisae]
MKAKLADFFHRHISKHKLLAAMPAWMKSSAIQQGLMFGSVSLISLVLMAAVTFIYVEHELKDQNREIVKESQELLQGRHYDVDDDPIEDDEILAVLTSGFVLAGVLVSMFTTVLVIVMSRVSQKRINRIERVLNAAADGDLSARTDVKYIYNDLARISVSVDDMLSRLEGSVAAMSDISANIAHELKTPITRLRHNLLILREDANRIVPSLSDTFLLELDKALDDSQRLAAIFDALLRISQIESGARRSRFMPLDLNDVVDTVAEIYGDVAEDAKMTLRVEKSPVPLMIQGDRELLIQQIANLIENALRYCPAGSNIQLRCGETPENGTVWVDVCDNGPGIADKEKERVFERLYRVDKSRTDGGLGLGLSLAKAVAGLHHGNIALYDAAPGLGVKVSIPVR